MLNKKNFSSSLLFVSCLVGSVSSQVQAEGMSSSAATLKPYVTLGANWMHGDVGNWMNMRSHAIDDVDETRTNFAKTLEKKIKTNSLGGNIELGLISQKKQWLYGIEAGFSYTKNRHIVSTSNAADLIQNEVPSGIQENQTYNSLSMELTRTYAGKLIGQVGYAINPEWHVLFKAGVVNARFKYKASYEYSEDNTEKSRAFGRNLWGGILGCTVLYNISPQWGVGLNYEYQMFSAKKKFPDLDPAAAQSLRPKINPHYHIVGMQVRYSF